MEILVSKINYLGDAVSFLPTLRGLAQCHADARVRVLCTPLGREVFDGCAPNVDFIVVDSREMRGWRSVLAALRLSTRRLGLRPDASFHSYDEPSLSYLFAYALRTPRRIGFRSGIARLQSLLTEPLPFSTDRNVVDINFDLVRHALGASDPRPHRIPIAYSPKDSARIESLLNAAGIGAGDSFVAIHPGARNSYREWPVANFAAVAERLEKECGLPCVFVSERPDGVPGRRQIHGLTIKQLACLLGRASLFLGNNSGPMHVAAAMGTPCVVVQGPTAANWDIFWTDRPHRILKAGHLACLPCERLEEKATGICANTASPNACMKAISAEQVFAAAAGIVRGTPRSGDAGGPIRPPGEDRA